MIFSSSSCDDPFVFRDTQEEEALQQKTETSTRPKMASPMETSTRPHSQQHTPESTTLAAPRSPYYPLKVNTTVFILLMIVILSMGL